MDRETAHTPACAACGSGEARPAKVRSAFWHGDRLVVVEDIPALACGACGEQSLDDRAVILIDLLRGEGFPAARAKGELRVPVFSLAGRTTPEGAS